MFVIHTLKTPLYILFLIFLQEYITIDKMLFYRVTKTFLEEYLLFGFG